MSTAGLVTPQAILIHMCATYPTHVDCAPSNETGLQGGMHNDMNNPENCFEESSPAEGVLQILCLHVEKLPASSG